MILNTFGRFAEYKKNGVNATAFVDTLFCFVSLCCFRVFS